MKNLNQSAFLLLTLGALSAQVASAGYYPTDSYKAPWLDPRCETTFTAGHGSVKAKLRIDANMFDGGPADNTTGKLEFFVNSSKRQEENIGPLRDIQGPFIGQNKAKRRTEIVLDLSIPPSQSKPSGYYSYRYNNVTREFPEELKKHAKAVLGKTGNPGDSNIIAYVGDLCLLGQSKKALSELKRLETDNTKKRHNEILQELKKRGYLRPVVLPAAEPTRNVI